MTDTSGATGQAGAAAGVGSTVPTGRRILVVEDDRVIADAVARRLSGEGHAVDTVHDGLAAVAAADAVGYDLVVLDLMLPGLDGLEVCRRVQASAPVPVLMLTARDDEVDRVVGLGVGADDYLTKPFSPRELVARVAALLRRVDRAATLAAGPAPDAGHVVVGDLVVDVAARRVRVDGAEVHLTRTEFELLAVLAREAGRVVPRDRLLRDVWHWSGPDALTASTRTLDSHVKTVRRKLGRERIRTVHGVGYALEVAG